MKRFWSFLVVFLTVCNFSFAQKKTQQQRNLEKRKEEIATEIAQMGTGESTILPNQNLIDSMYKKNKGLDFMNTDSACKTHNILLSENRSFISILYP